MLQKITFWFNNNQDYQIGLELLKNSKTLNQFEVQLLERKPNPEKLKKYLKRAQEKLEYFAATKSPNLAPIVEAASPITIKDVLDVAQEAPIDYTTLQGVSNQIVTKVLDEYGEQKPNVDITAEAAEAYQIDQALQGKGKPKIKKEKPAPQTEAQLIQARNNLRTKLSKLRKQLELNLDLAKQADVKNLIAQTEIEINALNLQIEAKK